MFLRFDVTWSWSWKVKNYPTSESVIASSTWHAIEEDRVPPLRCQDAPNATNATSAQAMPWNMMWIWTMEEPSLHRMQSAMWWISNAHSWWNVCSKTNLTEAKYSPIPYTPVVSSSCSSHCWIHSSDHAANWKVSPTRHLLTWIDWVTWDHLSTYQFYHYIWWIIDQSCDLITHISDWNCNCQILTCILLYHQLLTSCIFCFHLLPPTGEWEFGCSMPKHCGCGTGTAGTAGTDIRMQRTQTVYRETGR